MKIALQYREQARRVYYGAVFEAKKEILALGVCFKLKPLPKEPMIPWLCCEALY
jgi:hypothetical protein